MLPQRQIPCPDCGAPVRPEQEQLCPSCGYPLMFLRQQEPDTQPRAVPRSPDESVDSTRQFPTQTYGRAPQPVVTGPGPQCPACGYPNEPARVRCERCGRELRQARPQQVVLGPPEVAPPDRRWLMILLIVLAVLAVLSLLSAGVAFFWDDLTGGR
jgi:predicted amidophosphoribosyltransferase